MPKDSNKEKRDQPGNLLTGKLKKRNPALMISAELVLQKLNEKQEIVLIDVRNNSEFRKFRIPGSINIPLFAIKTKSFLKSKPLVLINEGYSYSQLEQECMVLRNFGFKASILDGGIYHWKQTDSPLEGDVFAQRELNKILPQAFLIEKDYENWVAIDVSQKGIPEGHYLFPVVTHIPYSNDSGQFISKLKSFVHKHSGDPFLSFLIYDTKGENYEKIEAVLQKTGVRNVFYLKGGLEAYKMLSSIQQREDEQGRTKATKTIKKCASCP